MMFGFLKEENGRVAIANRIFEMYLSGVKEVRMGDKIIVEAVV